MYVTFLYESTRDVALLLACMCTSLVTQKGSNLGATPAPGQNPSAPGRPKCPMRSRWNPDGTPMCDLVDVAGRCMHAPKYDDPKRKQPPTRGSSWVAAAVYKHWQSAHRSPSGERECFRRGASPLLGVVGLFSGPEAPPGRAAVFRGGGELLAWPTRLVDR